MIRRRAPRTILGAARCQARTIRSRIVAQVAEGGIACVATPRAAERGPWAGFGDRSSPDRRIDASLRRKGGTLMIVAGCRLMTQSTWLTSRGPGHNR